MTSGASSESDALPTAAQWLRRPTPPPTAPPPPPPPPQQQQQPAGSTSVREPTVVLKLEGEDRPFPSAPEVHHSLTHLQGVLNILKEEGITIDGLVRTGACYHEVWPQKPTQTDRVMEALNGRNILHCHACGSEGHFKADCPRTQHGEARATVAATGGNGGHYPPLPAPPHHHHHHSGAVQQQPTTTTTTTPPPTTTTTTTTTPTKATPTTPANTQRFCNVVERCLVTFKSNIAAMLSQRQQ